MCVQTNLNVMQVGVISTETGFGACDLQFLAYRFV